MTRGKRLAVGAMVGSGLVAVFLGFFAFVASMIGAASLVVPAAVLLCAALVLLVAALVVVG